LTVTTYRPSTAPPAHHPDHHHQVALWAGVASFFGSLLAIGIFDVFDITQWAQYLGAILVAAITGGAVYSKERLDDAKREEQIDPGPPPPKPIVP
jgi:hypothetical protein